MDKIDFIKTNVNCIFPTNLYKKYNILIETPNLKFLNTILGKGKLNITVQILP